jgi:two-component system sensor histidine kinase RstB
MRLPDRPLPFGLPGGLPGGPFDGLGIVLLLGSLFLAVALGTWPVVRRLTRRLEALKQGVRTFGAGALHHRVAEDGRDEVAQVAAAFNQAATRVQELLRSHQSLLANASHELR